MFPSLVRCLIIIIFKGNNVCTSPPQCDSSYTSISRQGIIGQTATFQWLGAIEVHLREGTSQKTALTGVVLVKEGYAIANADDVANIPERIFKERSVAMFLGGEAAWQCRLRDYVTPPDRRHARHALALVRLDAAQGDSPLFPLRPICWPAYGYNISDQLYAAGYTDDNEVLEKFVLKLKYVDLATCNTFYNKAGLSSVNVPPTNYQCAYAPDGEDNCVWENGLALISNASGYWTLIGLGLHGPGCTAPGRFINLLPYYQWIDSVTYLLDVGNDANRRSTFNEGFKSKEPPPQEEIEEVPLHQLLRFVNDTNDPVGGKHEFAHHYPSNAVPDSVNLFSIERINQSVISIHNISDGQFGNCSTSSNRIIYNDNVRVEAPSGNPVKRLGTLRYKLSMFDLYFLNYTCVKIEVVSVFPESAYLYYSTEIDQLEGNSYVGNLDDIIKIYPIPNKYEGSTEEPTEIMPYSKMKVKTIEETLEKYDVHNINVYMKIVFEDVAWFKVIIFGPHVNVTTTSKRITSLMTTASPINTIDPYDETEPSENKSLRAYELNKNMHKFIPDEEDLRNDPVLDRTIVLSTTTTPSLDWGRRVDYDDDGGDRNYWNTWKRVPNKTKLNIQGEGTNFTEIEKRLNISRLSVVKKRKSNFNKVLKDIKAIAMFNSELVTKSVEGNFRNQNEKFHKDSYVLHGIAEVEELRQNFASQSSTTNLVEFILVLIILNSLIDVCYYCIYI